MRWKDKPAPESGTLRYTRKFAWFPEFVLTMDGWQNVWLEFYWKEEVYGYISWCYKRNVSSEYHAIKVAHES